MGVVRSRKVGTVFIIVLYSNFAGAEHKSDHRIVVCRLILDKYYLVFKKKPAAAVKYW